MAKSKGNVRIVKMVSTEGTGEFYTTTINKRNHPSKMVLKKYDKKLRKHVDFKEEKAGSIPFT